MTDIPRVVERDASTELVAMAIMLYSLPRPKGILACEALLVYPGMGETWRLKETVEDWENPHRFSSYTKYLLVAGTEWEREKGAIKPPILENLSENYGLRKTEGVHFPGKGTEKEGYARHTKDQAEWVVDKVQELNIKSLALYVSPYHLLRAYLTLLKTFINQKVRPIPMIPVPVAISPATIIPETGTDAWSMVQGEMDRIRKYQAGGDVASLEELQNYLNWLWVSEPVYHDAF